MEIAYVRTYEAYDRCHVVRDDGSEDAFLFHAYGGALPHDLVHYAVEAAFGLQRAVWGSVAAGLDLARANQHANRKGGTDKWRDAFGDAYPEVIFSEGLTTVAWSEPPELCLAAVQALAERCDRSPPTRPQVEHAQALLEDLRARWSALGPREALALAWPLSELLRGASPHGDTRTSARAAAGSQSDRQRGR